MKNLLAHPVKYWKKVCSDYGGFFPRPVTGEKFLPEPGFCGFCGKRLIEPLFFAPFFVLFFVAEPLIV